MLHTTIILFVVYRLRTNALVGELFKSFTESKRRGLKVWPPQKGSEIETPFIAQVAAARSRDDVRRNGLAEGGVPEVPREEWRCLAADARDGGLVRRARSTRECSGVHQEVPRGPARRRRGRLVSRTSFLPIHIGFVISIVRK